jgi:hypothetical protein
VTSRLNYPLIFAGAVALFSLILAVIGFHHSLSSAPNCSSTGYTPNIGPVPQCPKGTALYTLFETFGSLGVVLGLLGVRASWGDGGSAASIAQDSGGGIRLAAIAALLIAVGGAVGLGRVAANTSSSSAAVGGPGPSLLISKNLVQGIAKLKAEQGGDAIELLHVTISPANADFELARGDTAAAYNYFPNGDLQSRQVNVSGTGSLAAETFPVAELDPSVVDTLVTDVKTANPDFSVLNLDLSKDFSASSRNGGPLWSISAQGGGRNVGYTAEADGSDFKEPGASSAQPPLSSAASPGAASPSAAAAVRDAQRKTNCIKKANGNVTRIQACMAK